MFIPKSLDPVACKIPKTPEEKSLAELQDSSDTIAWRIFRIMAEFVSGFHFISRLGKSVTFFGSGRFTEDNPYYKEAAHLAYELAGAGFNIISGGGPGIMEAGNKGAFEAGKTASIGLNIQLPAGQRMNKYITHGKGFHYFFTRKVMLSAASQAYVFFPGGFGTLDEFFEIITLIQTQKMEKIPVIAFGSEYWQPLHHWLKETLVQRWKTIEPQDIALYTITDSVAETIKIIKSAKPRQSF